MIIPVGKNVSLLETLKCTGAQVDFSDGSFMYIEEDFIYPHRGKRHHDGRFHDKFPATEEGLCDALYFLQ